MNDSKEDKLENLKKLKIKSLLGIRDPYVLQRKLSPKAQYEYAYILLDTNNIAEELSSATSFAWRVSNFPSTNTGNVTVANNIRDVVAVRAFPSVINFTGTITESGKRAVNTGFNQNYALTMLIEEFKAQSYVGREGKRFHFNYFPAAMNITQTGQVIYIETPQYYEYVTTGRANGWFWFRNAITEFHTLTISFGNPFMPINRSNVSRSLIPLEIIYLADRSLV